MCLYENNFVDVTQKKKQTQVFMCINERYSQIKSQDKISDRKMGDAYLSIIKINCTASYLIIQR